MNYDRNIVKKLGVVSNINYIRGLIFYGFVIAGSKSEMKEWVLVIVSILLVISVVLHIAETRIKASISHGAINAITQIYIVLLSNCLWQILKKLKR